MKPGPVLVCCALLAALAGAGVSAGQVQSGSGAIGQPVSIQSKILKQNRSLKISRPDGYDEGTERYPVLYLLDAESNFEFTAAIVHFLAENERIPAMVVVGVDSGDFGQRTRDLTPPTQNDLENRFSPQNGGADVFLIFLSDELLPFVDRNYRTRPYKVLIGHSFGGLFAIHTLATKPTLFNAYIAIDPTAGWNNGAEIARLQRTLTDSKELQADLFLAAANDLGSASPDVQRLASALEGSKPTGFQWKFEWMKDETHSSIPLSAAYAGLCAVFDGWSLTDPLQLFDKGGLEAIDRHFRDGGKRAGYERSTPPFTISLVVAGLIRRGSLEDAGTVLLHDAKAYPPPWNQLDALARAYAARGDATQAIRFYRLSLRENPRNDWARQKLKEMGADPGTPIEDRQP